MQNPIPIVAAVHDLAGFGRCSLSVVMPVLSAMGMQACPMPTAVLSTHTGGFEGYTFVDLTDTLTAYYKHWRSLNIRFDCIYSGFLGSAKQVDILSDMIDAFADTAPLVIVDPAFADDGTLYSTFDNDFVPHMRRLVARAHIVTPNITEAAFLLGRDLPKVLSAAEAREWLCALAELGPETVIITSAPLKDSKTSVIAYDKKTDTFLRLACTYIPAEYPGTGDTFASVLTGALLQKSTLEVAITRAVEFVSLCIRSTFEAGTLPRDGVLLEQHLGTLAEKNIPSACKPLTAENI